MLGVRVRVCGRPRLQLPVRLMAKRALVPRGERASRVLAVGDKDTRTDKEMRAEFLEALETSCLNDFAAASAAMVPYALVEQWRKDPGFAEREERVVSALRKTVEEESLRIALGRGPSCKDSAHLRWLLGKVDPEKYGDKPKVLEHRYSGSVDMNMKRVDQEILTLLGDAVEHESEAGEDGGEAEA